MKRALSGASAVALATAFASTASAAEFETRVGGYFETRVAFSSIDTDDLGLTGSADFDGVDVKRDAEIHFKPSITLDNGIKVGATVELEAATTGDQIDESYISIDGSFGRVLIGSENSARYLMSYGAPDASSFGVSSGDSTAHIPISGSAGDVDVGADIFRGTLGSTYIENGRNNDAERITYFTPRMSGIQAGLSYARDDGDDSNAQENLDGVALGNIADLGVNYIESINGVDVVLAGGWGIAFGDAEENPQVWNAGANFTYDGWTVGGSFAEQNNADAQDGSAFDVGIQYETGPWAFSFSYFTGENVDNEVSADGDNTGQLGNDESLQTFLLGARYALAKGVNLNAFGAYTSFDEETSDDGASKGNDISGFVIGGGMRISF